MFNNRSNFIFRNKTHNTQLLCGDFSTYKNIEIIVINDGRVEEIGDHDELMQQNGLYTEMFNKQREWYGEVD